MLLGRVCGILHSVVLPRRKIPVQKNGHNRVHTVDILKDQTHLGQAEKELLVPYNAASKATPPKALPPEVNSFQPQEITAILEALEEEPIKWRTIVHLMIVTGCRRGEIMGLKWENVDLESRMICVREMLLAVETSAYQDTPKTRESHRYINIPSETADLLREYRRSQSQIRTILGDR